MDDESGLRNNHDMGMIEAIKNALHDSQQFLDGPMGQGVSRSHAASGAGHGTARV